MVENPNSHYGNYNVYEVARRWICDFRNRLNAKKPETLDDHFQCHPYPQVFGKPFVKHMSVVDLIFCSCFEARQFVEPRNAGK